MKNFAIRQAAFGLLASTLFGVASAALAQLVSTHYLPTPFSWPFAMYLLAGLPLSYGMELIPGFEALQWRLFPAGGPAGAFFFLLIPAFITWAVLFSGARVLWLHKRGAAPNNSFKPTPLRGAA